MNVRTLFSNFIAQPAAGMGSDTKDRAFARLSGHALNQKRLSLVPTQTMSIINTGDSHEKLHQIEHDIAKNQMQKEEYENELNKIPSAHRRAFAFRDRKNFLTSEIEKLDKQINEGKLFLRKKKFERDHALA